MKGSTLSYCNSYRHRPRTHPIHLSFYRQINAIQCESNSIPFNKVGVLTNVNDFSVMLLVTTFIKLLVSLADSVDSPASLSSLSESMFQNIVRYSQSHPILWQKFKWHFFLFFFFFGE